MNLIYKERGSVEANFSLHGCKTANFTYFKKVSGVCALSWVGCHHKLEFGIPWGDAGQGLKI